MSAERLREAAALMRSRAEAAEIAFKVTDDDQHVNALMDVQSAVIHHPSFGEHIASWHPAVALAVADLIEAVDRAARLAGVVAHHPEAASIRGHALAVADAYLGATS